MMGAATSTNSATANPCDECPFRRSSARGWLGPLSADEWILLIHSDAPIACHQTIEVSGTWTENTLQCRGAAIFRDNVHKLPRDREVVVGPRDTVRVFATNVEFREHHDSILADFLAEQRSKL